jgi:hypothetical protein
MLKSAPSRSGVAQPLARVTAQKRSYALAGVDVPADIVIAGNDNDVASGGENVGVLVEQLSESSEAALMMPPGQVAADDDGVWACGVR